MRYDGSLTFVGRAASSNHKEYEQKTTQYAYPHHHRFGDDCRSAFY